MNITFVVFLFFLSTVIGSITILWRGLCGCLPGAAIVKKLTLNLSMRLLVPSQSRQMKTRRKITYQVELRRTIVS